MTRHPISYKSPSRLAIRATTATRHDDTERGTLWTNTEVTWLLQNYALLSLEYCAKHLRRSDEAVKSKADRMGLSPVPPDDVLAKMIDAGRSKMRQLAHEISTGSSA